MLSGKVRILGPMVTRGVTMMDMLGERSFTGLEPSTSRQVIWTTHLPSLP